MRKMPRPNDGISIGRAASRSGGSAGRRTWRLERRRRRRVVGSCGAAVAFAATIASCTSPGLEADFRSSDPRERTLAATEAARAGDPSAVPELIAMLESEDDAARLAAIASLRAMTGETLGYDFAAPRDERLEAAARWRRWARENRLVEPRTGVSPMDDSAPDDIE